MRAAILLMLLASPVYGQEAFNFEKVRIQSVSKKQSCKTLKENGSPLWIRMYHSPKKNVPLTIHLTEATLNGEKIDDILLTVKSKATGVTRKKHLIKSFCKDGKSDIKFNYIIFNDQSKAMLHGNYKANLAGFYRWKITRTNKFDHTPPSDKN